MFDAFEYVMNVVVHCSHLVKSFFCGRSGKFIVVIKVYGAWIKAVEASELEEFMGSGGRSLMGKLLGASPR